MERQHAVRRQRLQVGDTRLRNHLLCLQPAIATGFQRPARHLLLFLQQNLACFPQGLRAERRQLGIHLH